ncbi:MAG: hypothetical protein JSV09_04710, partial [Thermoplasmata archaeon]
MAEEIEEDKEPKLQDKELKKAAGRAKFSDEIPPPPPPLDGIEKFDVKELEKEIVEAEIKEKRIKSPHSHGLKDIEKYDIKELERELEEAELKALNMKSPEMPPPPPPMEDTVNNDEEDIEKPELDEKEGVSPEIA